MHEEMRKIHTRKCAYIRVNALYVNTLTSKGLNE